MLVESWIMVIGFGIKVHRGLTTAIIPRVVRYAQSLALVTLFLTSTSQLTFSKSIWDEEVLIADVEKLNEIVTRYKRAGGWFSPRDNAQRVMARLAMAQGDFGVTMLGKNTGHRMVPVIATEPPQKAKWAYWNVASEQFQIWRGVAPHQVQIVTRFARRQDAAPIGVTAQPLPRPNIRATRSNREEIALASEPPESGFRATSPSLLPPQFDPPAGKFNAVSFENLTVQLMDRNKEGAGKIKYSIDGSSWKHYQGKPLRVNPGSEILAYCDSVDGERLSDSDPVAARYVLEPLKINLELRAPVRQLPEDALRVGKGGGGLFPILTISNIASVPASVRSRKFFEVVWTIDGSDPLDSETAFPVTFSGSYGTEARLPISVFSKQSTDTLRIRAAARSTDRHLMLDSREAALDLEIVR